MLKVREYKPRQCCTDKLLKELRALDFKTDGYIRSLEEILKSKGFGLPVELIDEDGEQYFHFMVNYKWIRYYLNYADALANEIILLKELNLFKKVN